MLALLLACSTDPKPDPHVGAAEHVEGLHSHAEEDQMSITPRGIGPYRIGRSRAEITALPEAAPAEDGSVAFRGIVVRFAADVVCEVEMIIPGLASASGMEVGLPLSEFTRAHGDIIEQGERLTFANAAWLRVTSDGGEPPRAASIVLGACD